MNCYKHNEVPAEDQCVSCRQAVCADCKVVVKDQVLCDSCARDRLNIAAHSSVGYKSENNMHQPRPAAYGGLYPDKSKLLTFFLSFCPGLGHWYLGLEVRGLYFVVSFFGLIAAGTLLNAGIVGLALGPLWLYAIADAMWAADEINGGIKPVDKPPVLFGGIGNNDRFKKSHFGIALIIIGAISLFNNLPPYIISDRVHYWVRSNLFGAALIGVGVWLLMKRRTSESRPEDGQTDPADHSEGPVD